jgi:hypothetical protein
MAFSITTKHPYNPQFWEKLVQFWHTEAMLSPLEIQAVLERLDFVKSHTAKCRTSNSIKRYDVLKRKTRTCPYYACGVHETAKGAPFAPKNQHRER